MRKGTMLTRTSFLERRRRLARAAALRRQRTREASSATLPVKAGKPAG